MRLGCLLALILTTPASRCIAIDVKVGGRDYELSDYEIRKKGEDGWAPVASFPIPHMETAVALRPSFVKKYRIGPDEKDSSALLRVESKISTATVIGPRIWVAFSFYDGEFVDGIGGIGFYDSASHTLGILRHPALVACSTKSLFISSNTIHAVTVSFGEDGERPCSGTVDIELGALPDDASRVGLDELMVRQAERELAAMARGSYRK